MTSIDKRVVQMEFDNAQFEKNIKQSNQSLKNLDANLKLQNGVKGFQNVQRAADSMRLDGIAAGVDTIKEKFSLMGAVAFSAVQRVTNAVIDMGAKVARGVTIQPMLDGLDEYTLKMNSIKTIQTNTLGKSSLKDINETLNELNTYADKTIYNFAEMTRNIGTFTAAGVGLKQSAESIKGIANLAAASGSSSQQASVAMYQLSQAIAAGRVNLQDWNSVVNAGMGGKMFQNALIRTSKAFGTGADEMIKKYGTFRESLSKGQWLTTDVLTKTLRNFTLFTNEMSEQEKEQARAMLKKEGYTKQQIKQIEQEAAAAEEAATKVRTFQQFIDTTKEELGSGWAQTWELIIGDLSEAETLWTSISNVVNGFIGGISQSRNETLELWKDLGGRKDVLKGFKNIYNLLTSITKPISEAFNDIFKPITGNDLADASKKFKAFTKTLKISDETVQVIKSTFTGFFTFLKKGFDTIVSAGSSLAKIIGPLAGLVGKVLGVAGTTLGSIFGVLSNILPGENAGKGLDGIAEAIGSFITAISNGIPTVETFSDLINSIGNLFASISQSISNGVDSITTGVGNGVGGLIDNFGKVGDAFKKAFEPMSPILDSLGKFFSDFMSKIQFGDITAMFLALVGALGAKGLFGVLKQIKSIGESAKEGFGIKDLFDNIGDTLESFKKKTIDFKPTTLLAIAASITMLAVSLAVIAALDTESITKGLAAIATMLITMIGVIGIISALDVGGSLKGVAASFIGIGVGIALLSGAVASLGQIPAEQIMQGLLSMIIVLYSVAGAIMMLKSFESKASSGAASMLAISVAMLILSGALKVIASIPAEQLYTAIGAIGASLLILGTALEIMQGNISAAASLVIISAGLLILAAALLALGSVPIEKIAVGLVTMFSSLLILGVLSGIFETVAPAMLAVSASLVVFSVAALILAAGLAALGAIPLENLGTALLALSGALLVLGVSAALLGELVPAMLGVGAAMIVMSVGMLTLAAGLAALGAIPLENVGTGLLALAGTLLIFGVAATLMAPLIPAMLGLGAAMLVLGAGTLVLSVALGVLGGGFLMFLSILGLLPSATTTSVDGMEQSLDSGFNSMTSSMVPFGGSLITGLISGIGGGLKSLASAAADTVGSFISGAKNAIGGFFGVGEEASTQMGEGLEEGAEKTEEVSAEIPQKAADNISENADKPAEAAAEMGDGVTASLMESFSSDEATAGTDQLMEQLTSSLEGGKGDLTDISASFGPEISSSMAEGLDSSKLDSGVTKMVGGSVDKGKSKAKDAKSIGSTAATEAGRGASQNASAAESGGRDIGQGLVDGIRSKTGAAGSAGYDIGAAALREAKRAVKSSSPSKEFHKLGVDIDRGLILGIQHLQDRVEDAGYNVGKKALGSARLAVQSMSYMIDGLDTSPTIRPIIDLTDVQQGIDSVNSLFAGQTAWQAGLAYGTAESKIQNGYSTAPSKQVNNTISINLDYNAGEDANQIVRDIATGLMAQAFMEG